MSEKPMSVPNMCVKSAQGILPPLLFCREKVRMHPSQNPFLQTRGWLHKPCTRYTVILRLFWTNFVQERWIHKSAGLPVLMAKDKVSIRAILKRLARLTKSRGWNCIIDACYTAQLNSKQQNFILNLSGNPKVSQAFKYALPHYWKMSIK